MAHSPAPRKKPVCPGGPKPGTGKIRLVRAVQYLVGEESYLWARMLANRLNHSAKTSSSAGPLGRSLGEGWAQRVCLSTRLLE